MSDQDNTQNGKNQGSGFARFAGKRIAIAVVLISLAIWAFSVVPDMLRPSGKPPRIKKTTAAHSQNEAIGNHSPSSRPAAESALSPRDVTPALSSSASDHGMPADDSDVVNTENVPADSIPLPDSTSAQNGHPAALAPSSQDEAHAPDAVSVSADKTQTADVRAAHVAPETPVAENSSSEAAKAASDTPAIIHPAPSAPAHTAPKAPEEVNAPTGVVFVEAVIKPLNQELHERWWGWRPNDLINLTDNVNNMQLGILEVTRRSAIQLSERISRTGTTDTLNRHLENAVNWLMVRPDRYWFPSPETKYKESLEELRFYIEQLMKHQTSFYIRPDNIIPLLSSYEELLGSCDENLVKQKEKVGSPVSLFKADDYFYYAKGVASAMATILQAVHHDFAPTLENRHGIELLHHAIISCQQAAELNPLLITNGDLDGIFANHRANIAAPISHARFYIGQLIKTLST